MTLIFNILFKQIILSRHKKKVVYICFHYNWKWSLCLDSVLTVGRRPSFTAAGTPATVTTPVNRSTGPPTCPCVCRPRTMPPTPGARTLAANQTAPPAPVPIAMPLTDPRSPITWPGDRLPPTCWKSRSVFTVLHRVKQNGAPVSVRIIQHWEILLILLVVDVSSVLFRALDCYMTDIVCCFWCWLAEWRFSESHEREPDQHPTATTTATTTTPTTTQNPEPPVSTDDKRPVLVGRGS